MYNTVCEKTLKMKEQKIGYSRQRDFMPGSKWLYLKIYGSIGNIDSILSSSVYDIVCTLTKKQMISRWFFIRYSDPDFHLRLRLELTRIDQIVEVLRVVNQRLKPLTISKNIYRISIDTYSREIERYGGFKLMDISETVFCHDSCLIVRILKELSSKDKSQERWKFMFMILDKYLDIIGYSLVEKADFTKKMSVSYLREFGVKGGNRQLSLRYRKLKPTIEKILSQPEEIATDFKLEKQFENWEKSIRAVVKGRNTRKRLEMKSIIHMSINRMFASSNRLNEMMTYNYLSRFYSGMLARKKIK